MAGCMRYCCASSNALTPERCSRSKRLWPRAAADGDAESTVGGSCWGSPTRTMAAPGRSTCRGMSAAGSSACAASSMMSASYRGALPAGQPDASSPPAADKVHTVISADRMTFWRCSFCCRSTWRRPLRASAPAESRLLYNSCICLLSSRSLCTTADSLACEASSSLGLEAAGGPGASGSAPTPLTPASAWLSAAPGDGGRSDAASC
mmetsp:Transcript_41264/g.123217  ORF Transcript_41264/g.123217 Transcript_41264/m.123217 type:complete len:207 (+) Transcript_41264:752-1372(+)